MNLTHDEHIQRHKELHQALDELLEDFVSQMGTGKLLGQTSILEFVEWSYLQTTNPAGESHEP